MYCDFQNDLKVILEVLGMTQAELAERVGVQQVTLSRSLSGRTRASEKLMESVYGFAYEQNIKLGRLKAMFWQETISPDHKLLFHGSKNEIAGAIETGRSRANNDMGKGFYTGESYDQTVSFVSGFERSSVYYLDLDPAGLRSRKYKVDRDWMLTIAYYRGTLDEYKDHPLIRRLVKESRDCDYIVAPIADNRMYQIIYSFIEGSMTDEQCKHCLAATNLGDQYVFISDKAASRLRILERGYISAQERRYYREMRAEDVKLGDDKVKLARIKYRGQGRYLDEILADSGSEGVER